VVTNNDDVWSWDFERIQGRADEDPDFKHHGDHLMHFFDVENDGLTDFIISESSYENNRVYIFKQDAEHNFHASTVNSGLNIINEENLAPGNVSPIDYDLDGDLDLIIGFDGAGMQLWRNDVGINNNWLVVKLVGAGKPGFSNRDAIGARVTVIAGDNTYTREVLAGHGHQCPQIPSDCYFGLGQAGVVDSITVRWLNLSHSEITMHNVAVNQFINIREYPETSVPDKGVRLTMGDTMFSPGEDVWLDAYLFNNGPDPISDVPFLVILDVFGIYFFYDGWQETVDMVNVSLPVGTEFRSILPSFEWPETGTGTLNGLIFWGGMLNEDGTDLLGGFDGLGSWTFGYGPE